MSLRNFVLALLFVGLACGGFPASAEPSTEDRRAEAATRFEAGDFYEAYHAYRRLALESENDPSHAADDLRQGIACLKRLGRIAAIDEIRDAVVETHAKQWRVLHAAATTLRDSPQHGRLVAGRIERVGGPNYDAMVNSLERDRVLALRLMERALPLVKEEMDGAAAASFHLDFAQLVIWNRDWNDAWKLHSLTDLDELPDYEAVNRGRQPYRPRRGTAVDDQGKLLFHHLPDSFAAARTDGERWRWLLEQAMHADKARRNEVRLRFAAFLERHYGVETLVYFGTSRGNSPDEVGRHTVHTLAENETIVATAIGNRRYELPAEFDFIRIYREIADAGKSQQGARALDRLANVFENRRQYPQAAEVWRRRIAEYGPGQEGFQQRQLDRIVQNRGQLYGTTVFPAGHGATVDYRFRNGRKVRFEAHAIDVERLLADVQAYMQSRPAAIDKDMVDLYDIGKRLMREDHAKYDGEQVAEWEIELEPREDHFDALTTITTPLQRAGVYLLSAHMDEGNTSRVIVWVEDTVIVEKELGNRMVYFVVDAATGRPLEGARVEIFGLAQRRVGNTPEVRVESPHLVATTDANGLCYPDPEVFKASNHGCLIVASKERGNGEGRRMAFLRNSLGYNPSWFRSSYDAGYRWFSERIKAIAITDRPVYRPGHAVQFKLWIDNARFDRDRRSPAAGRRVGVRILDARREQCFQREFVADEFGGVAGKFEIPADAPLGEYSIRTTLDGNGIETSGMFRVEEYKKPEFEVTIDAPSEPVPLGEKFAARVNVRYYFGAPVAEGTVRYRVTRTPDDSPLFPPRHWDWFYGPGYAWFPMTCGWYPGWDDWGFTPAQPSWWGTSGNPPELVAEDEVPIRPDGTIEIEIDTAAAAARYGERIHRYRIAAEVVDRSRRTIVGAGDVLVGRKPFEVAVWVDRGFHRVGDTVRARFMARTIDRQPVVGKGVLTMYRVAYGEDGVPIETKVQEWELDTDARGEAHQQVTGAQAGQYRLSYIVADAQGRKVEGGYLFQVLGEGFDGRGYRFNDLELIVEKAEYQPGDTVNLLVNTNRPDSTVLLFVRAVGGVYPRPEVIRIAGKSATHSFQITQRDIPNLFVEAITIADGRLHTEVRQIVVPPEDRVVNVEVIPSAQEYRPGDEATVQVRLTDGEGKPFRGSTVLTAYDKAVEYISGGSNVPVMAEYYWDFRRYHYVQTRSSLDRQFHEWPARDGLSRIGTFGSLLRPNELARLAEREHERERDRMQRMQRMRLLGGSGMGMMGGGGMAELPDDALANATGEKLPAALVEPAIRSDFVDTAYWNAAVVPDAQGRARLAFKLPDDLTMWKVRAWTMGKGTRVGQGEAEFVTNKNLIVRLQAPRFFTDKDEVVLSANVHNYLDEAKSVRVALELDGGELALMEGQNASLERTVTVPAGGETRVDWRVKAVKIGLTTVRMKALTDKESDAVEMRFPVQVHGMLKTDSLAGVIRPKMDRATMRMRVPAERRIEETRLEVRFSTTLAGSMVDALPYLSDYPYETTDATLHGFLPAVVTQNVLLGMNLDLKAIRAKRTNLDAQQIGKPRQLAPMHPVFDEAELAIIVRQQVERLAAMQLADGGWGWLGGSGARPTPQSTATIVRGLQVAKENGVALPPQMLERGVAWLQHHQTRRVDELRKGEVRRAADIDALVFLVLVESGHEDDSMRRFLFRDRTKLSVSSLTLLGLALHKLEFQDDLAVVLRNIEQYLERDDENQTAWLRLPEGSAWWHWSGRETEANAFYLMLLSRTDPQGETTSRLAKYLLTNRQHATHWSSHRETAVAIEALAEFLLASGEDKPDMTVELFYDGKKQKEVTITAENLFSFDNRFVVEGDAIPSGTRTIELRRRGNGPLYYNAYLTTFSLEDFIPAAGLDLRVNRKYYRLVRDDRTIDVQGAQGSPVEQRVERYVREELPNLAAVRSGDLVEIELEIHCKNDYEYLVFEDRKPAGFEPVDQQSGYDAKAPYAYRELRDDRVTFFVRRLTRGTHSLSYRMRAEIPGRFSALPTKAFAMYAPELQGNSNEIKLTISDAQPVGGP